MHTGKVQVAWQDLSRGPEREVPGKDFEKEVGKISRGVSRHFIYFNQMMVHKMMY